MFPCEYLSVTQLILHAIQAQKCFILSRLSYCLSGIPAHASEREGIGRKRDGGRLKREQAREALKRKVT